MAAAINDGYLNNISVDIVHCGMKNDKEFKHVLNYFDQREQSKCMRTIIYTRTVRDGKVLCDKLNEKFPSSNPEYSFARLITASLKKSEREKYFSEFESIGTAQKCRCLITVNCISEGVDLPHADTAIFACDKKSIINIIQCVGRVMRKPQDTKTDTSTLVIFSDVQNGGESEIDTIFENIIRVLNGEFGYHGEFDYARQVRSMFISNNSLQFERERIKDITNYTLTKLERPLTDEERFEQFPLYQKIAMVQLEIVNYGELTHPWIIAFYEYHKKLNDGIYHELLDALASLSSC